MVFWAAILVGALFVWLAICLGFFQTWSLLFSVVISIYLAIFLAPSVTTFAPTTGAISPYCTALSLTVLAAGCFAILYGSSYVFLTAQYKMSFPGLFDILLAGALGFLTGFLILSFVALIVTATPLAQNDLVKGMGLNPESEQANIACIAWCCDLVHSVAGPETQESATKAAIERLLTEPPSSNPDREPGQDEPNEPSVSRERHAPR